MSSKDSQDSLCSAMQNSVTQAVRNYYIGCFEKARMDHDEFEVIAGLMGFE